MENNEDVNIEKLVEQMMLNTALESPSVDFTQTVMSEVLALGKSKSLIYKPILSRRTWLVIFLGIIVIFIYSFFNSASATTIFNINFVHFKFDKLEKIFQDFKMPSLTGYVILLATLMIIIQTFLLKKYLDKRFES